MASVIPVSFPSSKPIDSVAEVRRISRVTKACLPPIATFSHNLAEPTSDLERIAVSNQPDGSYAVGVARGPISFFFCDWPGCKQSLNRVPFKCAGHLKRHMLTHCTSAPISCPECSLRFRNAENLKRHFVTHQGVKSYACEVCHRSFSRTSGRSLCRKRHKLVAQIQDDDQHSLCNKPPLSALELEVALDRIRPRPYKCSICGDRKSYTDPSSLRKHKRRCHSSPHVLPSKACQSLPELVRSPEPTDTAEPVCPSPAAIATQPNAPISNKLTPVQLFEDAALDLTEPQYFTASVADESAIDLSGDSTFELSSAPDPIDLSSSHHNYSHSGCETHPSATGDAEERLLVQQTRSHQQSFNWDPEPGFSFTDLLTNMELDEVDPVFSDPVAMLHDLSLSYSPSKSHLFSPPLDLRLIHTSFS